MRTSVSVFIDLQEEKKDAKDLIASVLPQLAENDEFLICGAGAVQAAEGFEDSRIKLPKDRPCCFSDAAKQCQNDTVFFGDPGLQDMYTFTDTVSGKTLHIPETLVQQRISGKKDVKKASSAAGFGARRRLLCEYEALEDAYYTGGKISGAKASAEKIKKAAWLLMLVFFTDVCIFGGGRIVDFGYVSFRMIVFAAAFILSLPLVFRNRKRLAGSSFVVITVAFGAVMVIWSVYGWINGNPPENIRSDITSCLTLALLPGLLCVADDKTKAVRLADVVFYSSLVLAFAVIILQFALPHGDSQAKISLDSYLNSSQVGGFVALQTGTYRVYFRSGIFTQAAMMIGIWKFWQADALKKKILFIIFEGVLIYSWIVSYTRGFWLGLAVSVVFVVLWQPGVVWKCLKFALCSLLVTAVITGLSWINEGAPNVPKEVYNRFVITVEQSGVSENPAEQSEDPDQKGMYSSNDIAAQNIRNLTKEKQLEYIRRYPVFGRGVGAYLEGLREESAVEYTYLDVLMKLGIVGAVFFALAFFVFLGKAFIHRVFRPRSDAERSFYTLSTFIMAGYIGIAVTSITNPFLISPLGISALLVTEAAVYNCRILEKKAV